jgi:glucosyl-dolichyl phosphate glucuronosyltransferase
MRFSVVIATYNRAAYLADTLRSLARLQVEGGWEAIVVDNNSTDHTRAVVSSARRYFPAPLRYLFESRQGRSPALNAGIAAARGSIIATTDDDVRVQSDWLTQAEAGLTAWQADYVGGRVQPIWEVPPPRWLPPTAARQWAVVALLDYGTSPLPLGRPYVPLGVNMAFRREAFARAGLFDVEVGRRAGTLLGQEVREWGIRAEAAHLAGWYVPTMVVHHLVPAARLRKRYFRRWFYWHGISRAQLYRRSGRDIEAPERPAPHATRHIAGVPRYLYRTCAGHAVAALWSAARGRAVETFDHELWLWFFAGVLVEGWRDRHSGFPVAAPGRLPSS